MPLTITVTNPLRIPRKNRLNRKAIEQFRQFRVHHVDLMKGDHFGN